MTALAAIGLTGCSPDPEEGAEVPPPRYEGAEVVTLDTDLIAVQATVAGTEEAEPARRYAECVAAAHTLGRGDGFLRHIRTELADDGGTWTANSVFILSAVMPAGLRTIDAQVAVGDCALAGVPTA